MSRGDIDVVRKVAEARLAVLLAEPRVQEALALQRWLGGRQEGPPPPMSRIAGPPAGNGRRRPGRPAGGANKTSLAASMHRVFQAEPERVFSADDMHKALPDSSRHVVAVRLGQLAQRGLIERVRNGRYRLAQLYPQPEAGEVSSEQER